jgi:predicted ATP-grasp superfamily ATP-dependent carboligase/protein-tyrosine-phosphatase
MKSDENPSVLVLDSDMVPSLTISRSLAHRGCVVDVASHIDRSLSSYSNAVNAHFKYPDPLSATEEFVEWFCKHVSSKHYDLVIPVTERTLLALSRRRDRLQHIKIAMPAVQSLEVALDKCQTLALADMVGVPRPMGLTLTSLDELIELKKTLKFPVVLKPARSIGAAEGGASHLQVSYAFDATELEAGCAHAMKFCPVLLQEFVPGAGVGIELIAQEGKIAYAFQHLRLHEVPLTGGGSSLRKSEPVVPALLEAAERLIAALKWNGVAMVEFKFDPASGNFCLMEINGRFWGSLPLAAAAGADFPSMLLDLELDGQIRPSAPYRNNVYCRLLSRDLHWYEAVLRGGTDPRIAKVPRFKEVFTELGLFFNFRHRFDVQSIRDPMPGLVDVGRILGSYLERLRALFQEKRYFFRQKRAWKEGEVSAAIAGAGSILFLCYGNINRSALAEVMVRGYAEDSGISVSSAGFHEAAGRPADPVMIDIARTFDLNLSNIRSSCVTAQQLRDSDIIFVMEKSHHDRVLSIDDTLSHKVYLLGAHPSKIHRSVEIEDPFGRAKENYLACYERVSEAVDTVKAVIAIRNCD